MTEIVLDVRDLTKSYGGLKASDGLSFQLTRGEIHAVIGPNGAGKSTFIAQVMGDVRPDHGSITFAGQSLNGLSTPQRVRLGLARTFQIPRLLKEQSVEDNIALAVQARQGHSFRFWSAVAQDRSLLDPASEIMRRSGLSARAKVPVALLSHGEHKHLELALALALRPQLLLLDEPMAGMGPSESRAMVQNLLSLKGQVSMLLVEHDMDAVFALADRISVLVYGRIIASGTPQEIRANAEVRAAYLGEEG